MKRMTLSTDRLNRYGYRIKTDGIDLTGFLKNPVMLFGHNTWMMPVGRWDDVKVEGGKLTGVPVFDESDEMGKALKSKFEGGFVFAASIGFKPIETSSQDLLPGQTLETVIKCELLEASIVCVPGNADATLSYDANSTLAISPITPISPDMDLKKFALALGLPETATEADCLSAITKLSGQVEQSRKDKVDALMALGLERGIVNDGNRKQWEQLAAADFDSTSALIQQAKPAEADEKKAPPTLTGMLSAGAPKGPGKQDDPRANWTFDEWSQKDSAGLLKMKTEDPERYKALAAAKYAAT